MIARAEKIKAVRDNARLVLFDVEQSLHRMVNDMSDVADSALVAHAAELADAIAAVARVRAEMDEDKLAGRCACGGNQGRGADDLAVATE